jgi:hypothetical protein
MGLPADVAQLVEHLLAMQKVVGSSPIIRSMEAAPKSRMVERKAPPRRGFLFPWLATKRVN